VIIRRFLSRFVGSVGGGSSEQELHNRRLLYAEVALAGVMGGIISFNATFALRLGASKEWIALLNSVPALVAALFSIPTAMFVQRRLHRERWLFGSLLVMRVGYGFVALIPLIFGAHAAQALVIWIILLNFPSIFFINGFQALLAELVPPERRAQVFARRTMLWSGLVVVTTSLSGQWLDQIPTPLNFMLLYAFGTITALGSSAVLSKLKVPPRKTTMIALPKKNHKGAAPATVALPVIEKAKLTRPVLNMLFNTGVYQFGLWLSLPLFAVYYVDILKLSNGWIGFNSAMGSFGVILGNFLWERLYRGHTFAWGLRRAMLITWTFPVLIALFPHATLILLFNLFVNLGHPGVDLASVNIMMRLGTDENRTLYMSWYNTVINVSAFIAPLLGVWLAEVWGIPTVFLIAGAVRLIGGFLFTVNRVEKPEPQTAAAA